MRSRKTSRLVRRLALAVSVVAASGVLVAQLSVNSNTLTDATSTLLNTTVEGCNGTDVEPQAFTNAATYDVGETVEVTTVVENNSNAACEPPDTTELIITDQNGDPI